MNRLYICTEKKMSSNLIMDDYMYEEMNSLHVCVYVHLCTLYKKAWYEHTR